MLDLIYKTILFLTHSVKMVDDGLHYACMAMVTVIFLSILKFYRRAN